MKARLGLIVWNIGWLLFKTPVSHATANAWCVKGASLGASVDVKFWPWQSASKDEE